MTNGSNAFIDVEQDGHVRTLTLSKPDRLNAIAPEDSEELGSALWQANTDPEVRVVILTGAGRGFCAGGDVKTMSSRNQPGKAPREVYSRGRRLINAFLSLEKPIIAKVNGPAVGLGATIALYCDMVVMADEAKIGDRHVNVGLVAGDGGAVVWPLHLGPARAKEYLMTGKLLTGKEAAQIGLVNRSVPLEELDDAASALAEELSALPPYAVRATKASVNRYLQWMTDHVLDASLSWEKISAMSQDHQEALRAREEGRPGVYEGT